MKFIYAGILTLMFMSTPLFAQEVDLDGTLPLSTHLKPQLTRSRIIKQSAPLKIMLLKVALSDKAQQMLASAANESSTTPLNQSTPSDRLIHSSAKVELGMNDVPVLNQGSHGSCVMFANTAAIDAALHKGDYISQLCQLQLGNYLQQNGYQSSGWDGTTSRFALNQIETFGFISKETEATVGCGGLNHYPLYEMSPETSISPEVFHSLSEKNPVVTTPILDMYNAFSSNAVGTKTLQEVKMALNRGYRVTVGVILLEPDNGVIGALGKRNVPNDTWVLTPELQRSLLSTEPEAAHAMIITGYDDRAVAVDEEGRKYRGLLTLRSSWGKQAGDQGDFYMTYDYFRLLVIEAQRIGPMLDTKINPWLASSQT